MVFGGVCQDRGNGIVGIFGEIATTCIDNNEPFLVVLS